MGKILILLFIFFIIIPLFRIGIAIYKAQRKAKKAFSQFHEEQQRQAQEFQSQQKKEQQRQRRQRMGEYVDFEEVRKQVLEKVKEWLANVDKINGYSMSYSESNDGATIALPISGTISNFKDFIEVKNKAITNGFFKVADAFSINQSEKDSSFTLSTPSDDWLFTLPIATAIPIIANRAAAANTPHGQNLANPPASDNNAPFKASLFCFF